MQSAELATATSVAGSVPVETTSTKAPQETGPIPLSFPSILRNPGITDRFSHLRSPSASVIPTATTKFKKNGRDEKEGKRWVRRKENARFVGNPHIVAATKKDYTIQPTVVRTTFPEPLPPCLPRSVKAPGTVVPLHDPNSANAGRFSMSLKGMRRDLRKSGFRAQVLVQDVEEEILGWLQDGGTIIAPNISPGAFALQEPGRSIGRTGTIHEVSRTPLELIWMISDDAFGRYVVHCCARYHEIVSFSKDLSGQRLTHLLRPNVTRPDSLAPATLDTPPVTDIDASSGIDSESDFPSDRELLSGVNESDVDETTGAPLGTVSESRDTDAEVWSVIGETDIEGDLSGSDAGLAASVESLGLDGDVDPDVTIEAIPPVRQSFARPRIWASRRRMNRSASSPSRSPMRHPLRPKAVPQSPHSIKTTFYDYLYA